MDTVPDPMGLLNDPEVPWRYGATLPFWKTSDYEVGHLLGRELNHQPHYLRPDRCRYCDGTWPCWAVRPPSTAVDSPGDGTRPRWP